MWKLICLLTIFFCYDSLAEELTFTSNSRTHYNQSASLLTKGLAYTCLSMVGIIDNIPCNPALVRMKKQTQFNASGLISNGYGNLSTATKLLANKADESQIESLLDQNATLQIEANTDIFFVSPYVTGKFTPFNVQFLSILRNKTYPQVELTAIDENGFTFQSGMKMTETFLLGAQLRVLDRKMIRKNFNLLSLATEYGGEALKPIQQTAVYLEPGILYKTEGSWIQKYSLMVKNTGYLSEEVPGFPTPPQVELGYSLSPPMKWGQLELGIDYKSITYDENAAEKIHFGSLYRFGTMYLAGGMDSLGMSLGVYYYISQLNAGILFSTTQVPWRHDDSYTQTVYTQFGFQL